MAGQWGGLRTIVPDNQVTETIDAECVNYPRLEDAWEALKWLLSRAGDRVGLPARADESLRLFVQADDVVAGVPALWVVYRVTPDEIQIQALHIEPPAIDDDEE